MSRVEKLLVQILRGASDANMSFAGLCQVLEHLGFAERVSGSHHIFTRDGVAEIINLQPVRRQGEAVPGQAGAEHYRKISVGGRDG